MGQPERGCQLICLLLLPQFEGEIRNEIRCDRCGSKSQRSEGFLEYSITLTVSRPSPAPALRVNQFVIDLLPDLI